MNRAIRPLHEVDRVALLALNNDHAVELSWLEADRLAMMLGQAYYARGFGNVDAALIAFDGASAYDGLHFGWFRARYPRFVYVDRVVVAARARGRGLARALYGDLFATAAADGQTLAAAEVNIDPPNPASLAFHAASGFLPVGEAPAPGGKSVRYFVRSLP